MAFDETSKGLKNWMKQFGIASHELSILNNIDCNTSEAEIFEKIKEVIEQILKIKQYETEQVKDQIR